MFLACRGDWLKKSQLTWTFEGPEKDIAKMFIYWCKQILIFLKEIICFKYRYSKCFNWVGSLMFPFYVLLISISINIIFPELIKELHHCKEFVDLFLSKKSLSVLLPIVFSINGCFLFFYFKNWISFWIVTWETILFGAFIVPILLCWAYVLWI